MPPTKRHRPRDLRRRSERLANKRQKIERALPALPYELWIMIVEAMTMASLRKYVKRPSFWKLSGLPLFDAFREVVTKRHNNAIKDVINTVNDQRECINLPFVMEWPMERFHLQEINRPKLAAIVRMREDIANMKSNRSADSDYSTLAAVMTKILHQFCREWIFLLLHRHPVFLLKMVGLRTGAAAPEDHKEFWKGTHVCSFQIQTLFLWYHYDVHVKVEQGKEHGSVSISACAASRWQCAPSTPHRDWPTWATMELRELFLTLLLEAIDWVMGGCLPLYSEQNIKRYCIVEEETYSHVRIAADVKMSPS